VLNTPKAVRISDTYSEPRRSRRHLGNNKTRSYQGHTILSIDASELSSEDTAGHIGRLQLESRTANIMAYHVIDNSAWFNSIDLM
jgi:hypothetical protein